MRLDILAALTGVLISLQTRANGELSYLINNGLEAALVSFGSGLIIILIINHHIYINIYT
jgi:transporter family-2 protein